MQTPAKEKKPPLFRLIYRIVKQVFPKYRLIGTENLPAEPCVIVGNHAQMYGPVAAELYMPRKQAIWCVGEMMDRKEVPAYAFRDFWSMKPKAFRWFFRLASHLIAPLAPYILNNAHTVPVWHDTRVLTTFRKSVELLNAGSDIVIFPEKNEPYNGILWQFQEHFADLAPVYYRKSGKALRFVPMYIAPRLSEIHFGPSVLYHPDAPNREETARICSAMKESITALAVSLPQHVVIPYYNLPKNRYPLNTDGTPAGTASAEDPES